jgi:Tfp pilus assembly protein FimT
MLVTLALLAAIMLIGMTLVQQVGSRQQKFAAQHRRLQADYLAESALDRTAAQLARNPQYVGETWEPANLSGANEQKGRAVITVKRQPDSTFATVSIIATFPLHPVNRAQTSIERILPLAKSE